MDDLEHMLAVYYDEGGERHDIEAEELKDDKKFGEVQAAAERNELWDISETIHFSVKPKSVDGKRRHFCAPSNAPPAPRVYGFPGEALPDKATHDDHVRTVLAKLKASRKLPWGNTGVSFDGYDWGSEVSRVHPGGVLARHDIYGQQRGLCTSIRRPALIVEVINWHYPEPPLLDSLFIATKMMPLVAFFEFVERGERFLRTKDREGQPNVWARAYMSQGTAHVYSNGRPLQEFSSAVSFLEALRSERDTSSI